MSEAQLKKVQAENARLQEELNVLSNARTTLEACEELVAFMESKEEPLLIPNNSANPWHQSTGGGCNCVVS